MNMIDLPASVGMTELIWFLANAVIGLVCLHIPYEMGRWYRKIPRGTGFIGLTQIFQVCFLAGAAHHFTMITQVSSADAAVYMAMVDICVMFIAVTASITLFRNRWVIRQAFYNMVVHYEEWTRPPE